MQIIFSGFFEQVIHNLKKQRGSNRQRFLMGDRSIFAIGGNGTV